MRNRSRASCVTGAFVALVVAVSSPASAQLEPIPQDRGGNGLGLALRRIGVTPRVLYVTAHPDDENNGMLVRLSRGQGVRTALLTLTRGDGGQNAIGPELFDALAVVRTEELAAIHRHDAVEQYFGLSSDFGYSFSVPENLEKWGREKALGDVVRVLRAFRPDVVITLPTEAKGGGQAHQAAGQLAVEAFRAAADPARFPDQGLAPWQAARVYTTGVGGGPLAGEAPRLTVPTGVYDPLLGLTWHQFGSVIRGLHRSQSAGQLMAPAGEGTATFTLADSAAPVTAPEADVLAGLDLTFPGLLRYAPGHETKAPFLRAELEALQSHADAARDTFDADTPAKSLAPLRAVLAGVQALSTRLAGSSLEAGARTELTARLADEERDAAAALTLAHGLDFEVTADDDVVVPGQSVNVTARVANLGAEPIAAEGVSLSIAPGWSLRAVEGQPRDLAPGATAVFRFVVAVPAPAPPTGLPWRRVAGVHRFELADPALAAQPWAPPPISAVLRYRSGGRAVAMVTEPAQWRYQWAGGTEKQKTVAVGSDFSVSVEPEVTVFPLASRAARELRVTVRNQRKGSGAGRVRLEVPAGWTVEPREAEVRFRHEGEEVPARFSVTPAVARPGEAAARAVFVDAAGQEFATGEQVIAYEHIQERRLVRPAVARVMTVDVATSPGIAVGYIDGVGDEVDTAIRQLGVPLTYLTADDLAFGDLSRFTTIVTGIRAYEARPDLRSFHHRLMGYVESGGNLVVQYNRLDFNRPPEATGGPPAPTADSPYAPYPASVTNDRITDENAVPRPLSARSGLLRGPNVISDADWQGWVQERGLNFLAVRDPRYERVVSFADPFPLNPGEKEGGLVDAGFGRGRWTYVGLGLFRQLPAGVPGAYRLLANLVSRPRSR